MSESYSVAFIGTGPNPETPVPGVSYAMAYHHAGGYAALDQCELVACADLVDEHATDFADRWEIDPENTYEAYEEMLTETRPDIVSVCTPTPTHADIVLDVLGYESVRAIHCEKPMADTWGDARLMAQEAYRRDVQLTFNHQRRFHPAYREAKRLLDSGDIGTLERIEMSGMNLFDYGTHLIDLSHFFTDECPVEWVIGQLDYREEDVRFGAHQENQGLALWAYENGVNGFASTGFGADVVDCQHRLCGTDGMIAVHPSDGGALRIRRGGDPDWEELDVQDNDAIHEGIFHIVACLADGTEPVLGARNALSTAEIIFGAWESVRRRGRVEFPLTVQDNPLVSMVESGSLTPETHSSEAESEDD